MIMKDIIINDTFQLSYPESFFVMSEEERAKLQMLEQGPGFCLSDPDNHRIVSVGWKKVGKLMYKFLKTKDIRNAMKTRVTGSMRAFQIRTEEAPQVFINGAETLGFGFSYHVQDVAMTGQSYVMKNGGYFYYFHFYGRTENREEGLQLFADMLSSIQLIKHER